jgi:hypothetical protein
MDRGKRRAGLSRCKHSYPVESLSVEDGKKKIAHCLGCGRSGPARVLWRRSRRCAKKRVRFSGEGRVALSRPPKAPFAPAAWNQK